MKKIKKHIYAININKNSKKRRVFAVLFIVFAVFYSYVFLLVDPLLKSACSSQVKVFANKSMNYAITEAMNKNITYDDLIHIITDSKGKISLLQANSVQLNSLSKLIGRSTSTQLKTSASNPVLIPLGAFSGISLLAGFGPKVAIEIYPYGDIGCRFVSEFQSAGINQTQHKIYLSLSCTINVVLPFEILKVKADTDVLLCESVIIGEIPNTYLQFDKINDVFESINLNNS